MSPPSSERADCLAKCESKQPLPCLSPLARKPKPCAATAKNPSEEDPLETTGPSQTQLTVWRDRSRPLYSGCELVTVACQHTWSERYHGLCSLRFQRRSTTSSRNVSSGSNRDTNHVGRSRQPPRSCRERRKTCTAPPISWHHVDWPSARLIDHRRRRRHPSHSSSTGGQGSVHGRFIAVTQNPIH